MERALAPPVSFLTGFKLRPGLFSMSLPPSSKKRRTSYPSSSFVASSPARSLDDDDVPVVTSAVSSHDVVHDLDAVKLCADMLTSLEQLKKLAEGRDERVTRFAEEKPGADIYELTLDRVRGSLSVKRVQEIAAGLDAATREARESLAHEIEKRKADIAGLEKEVVALGSKIQERQGEGVESLAEQLFNVHAVIGKHKKLLKELEGKSEVEIMVKVQRVSTWVELVKETSSEGLEVRMVPTHDAGGRGIYVMGGTSVVGNPNAAFSSVERYDVAKNRWEAVTSMNCKRDSHGSLVLGGKIYAVGGRCGISSNSVLNSVECFSPKSGRWELTASLPTSRQSYAMASLNDRLYLAGGFDGKGYLSSLISFDPGANQVQDLAPMTYRCGFTGGAVLDGLFYVVGGWDGKETLRTAERYDPASNGWDLVASMSTKRRGCAAVVCNGYLYALGGWDGSSYLSTVERFDPRLNSWQEVASMQSKRCSPAAAVLDGPSGMIYVMGGHNGTYLSSVERYDPATNRWEYVAPMSTVRYCATAVVIN